MAPIKALLSSLDVESTTDLNFELLPVLTMSVRRLQLSHMVFIWFIMGRTESGFLDDRYDAFSVVR